MSEVINPLPIPKPKRFAPKEKPPFLPLKITPTSSSLSKVTWSHYTAYLIGHWVTVFHKGDIFKLVGSNFGKGALSKFNLTFEDRDWKPVNVEAEKNVPEETENESGPQPSLSQAFNQNSKNPSLGFKCPTGDIRNIVSGAAILDSPMDSKKTFKKQNLK